MWNTRSPPRCRNWWRRDLRLPRKYYAYELTRRHAARGVDRLSQSLFDASVDLKPLAPQAAASRIEDVAGCLKPRRARVSLDEMNAAIADEAAKRHVRGRY